MEIQINGKDVTAECKDLIHAMARLEAVTGQRQAVVVRKGVIQLIKSLRALTTKADKLVPQKDVRKYNGDGPKWITKQGDKAKRRYTIVRRAGTEDSYGYTTLSTSEGRARSKAGKIKAAGFARKTWGHAMNVLFNRANPENDTSRIKVRPGTVDGYFREIETGSNPRVEVEVINSLKYITAATPDSVVSGAISAATAFINGQVQRAIEEARKKAGLD